MTQTIMSVAGGWAPSRRIKVKITEPGLSVYGLSRGNLGLGRRGLRGWNGKPTSIEGAGK
jgi:hypothetical protein